jgi:hypothetical protein
LNNYYLGHCEYFMVSLEPFAYEVQEPINVYSRILKWSYFLMALIQLILELGSSLVQLNGRIFS